VAIGFLRRIGAVSALALLAFAGCAAAQPAGALLSSADEEFLHDQARRIVASAYLAPGQSSGQWKNETPYALHVPGGNMGYPAFWVRDAVMMLGGGLISPGELEGWIRLMASTLRTGDWQVRPGVVVPAFAVPDHINFDGKAAFYPGSYETGEKQGGKPFGKYPPLDDDFYFINAVHEHYKLTGSLGLFRSMLKVGPVEMRLEEVCERVYSRTPVDPASGLCIAGDIETENAKDFGFCDGVSKSGKLLFTSVMKYAAATQLANMFRAAGQIRKSKVYTADAARIRDAIGSTFYRPSSHPREGWLQSATGVGNQPDVWGSAFAVSTGAVTGETARRVARSLVRAYREKTTVREGCVRHLLTTDPNGGWQSTILHKGVYQNGGYWGTATGWYLIAMQRVNQTAAREMARDYVGFLRTHTRPDGLAEAWEWFNPDTGEHNNPQYVATVALTYCTLRNAGLLADRD
jgi:glycogen debranching enzyme